jgi:MFS family permease
MNKRQNLRTFYILIITQTFSLIGSRMTGLALGIYIFNQTGQATPLALVALFSFLPQVVAGGLAGALADRWDRRYVMMLSDAGQALGTVILLGSFLTGTFRVELLYVVTLIQAIFGVFQSPAFQASVTMLIPDDQRDRANAIQQLTNPAAGLIAPTLAGGLYGLVGVNGVIAFDLFTFGVAVVVVLLLRIPRPAQTEIGRAMQGSIWREAFGGLEFLWHWRTLFWVNLQLLLVNFFFAGSTVVITPYLLARTGSEAALGTVLSVLNAGMIVGGVIMGAWGGTKPRIHTILPGIAIAACFLILLGAGQTALMLGAAGFFMMIPPPMINASVMSLMQAKVPPDIQGRVFAAMGQMATLLIPLAYLLVGPLADQVFEPAVGKAGWERVAPLVGNSAGAGMGLMMVIAGVILVVTTTAVYLIPRVRHLEAELPDYSPSAGAAPESGGLNPEGA